MQHTGQICFNITHVSRAQVGLNDDSELKPQSKKQAIVFARGLTEYSVRGLDPAVFRPAAAPVQLTAHKLRIGSNPVPFVLIGHLSWEAYGIGAACTISRSTIF